MVCKREAPHACAPVATWGVGRTSLAAGRAVRKANSTSMSDIVMISMSLTIRSIGVGGSRAAMPTGSNVPRGTMEQPKLSSIGHAKIAPRCEINLARLQK